MEILQEICEAHGGRDYWQSLEALDAEISASGFLFTVKRRPVLKHVRMRAYTREPRFTFFDYPQGCRNFCQRVPVHGKAKTGFKARSHAGLYP